MSHAEFVGRSTTQQDDVSPRMVRAMAATLGVAVPETLPPLWHWTLFQDWVPPERIGPDGHPKRGGFLPPVHELTRRMWAGGRVRFLGRLSPGETVQRISTIASVTEKTGGSGRLVFVTVRHRISGQAGLAIEEEQDIVYRSAEGSAIKPGLPVSDRAPPGPLARDVLPDPVTLFRYSALTGNGHRIHYDMDYVREVEGYPGLVVHGPLQATWLAGLLQGRALARFSFRGHRPAFHDRTLALEGREQGSTVHLRTLDPGGAVCMTAEAELAA